MVLTYCRDSYERQACKRALSRLTTYVHEQVQSSQAMNCNSDIGHCQACQPPSGFEWLNRLESWPFYNSYCDMVRCASGLTHLTLAKVHWNLLQALNAEPDTRTIGAYLLYLQQFPKLQEPLVCSVLCTSPSLSQLLTLSSSSARLLAHCCNLQSVCAGRFCAKGILSVACLNFFYHALVHLTELVMPRMP